VVVVGGTSLADRAVLAKIEDTARSVEGVVFDYWTNQPISEVYQAAQTLREGTVILLSTVQRDATGETLYTAHVVQTLAPLASVPVYVMGNSLIGNGAVGGRVVDFEKLGASVGKLAFRVLAGTAASQIPVEVKTNGVPMVDWRALQRWHIKTIRLPENCVIRYQPHSLWEEHWQWFLFLGTGFLAQAVTIAALLVQRKRKQHAEAEILRQRTELAHASRVSMMGQLASALTHELNQPLGAILRNAEAAEMYLQGEQPNLKEIQAILTDIRRDEKRAGNVIDRMRSLFKRQKLTLGPLDLRDVVEDTLAMVRPDAAARQVNLKVQIPPYLPAAQGDRVHVQQVLFNLVFNAMDALTGVRESRRSVAVELAQTKSGNLQVTVSDTGAGIAPDSAGHIFEPFFTTKSNGMGMGLAISKTIIEAHGGEIWMRSSAMDGTTFTFLLPPAGADRVKPGDLPLPLKTKLEP
jgi:signal transduction histidine kinase